MRDDARTVAQAVDDGRFVFALERILEAARVRDPGWVVAKVRLVASRCPEAMATSLAPLAGRVRRIFEEADRLPELPALFRVRLTEPLGLGATQTAREVRAWFPLAALGTGAGAIRALWVRRRIGGRSEGRFVGSHAPTPEFVSAVEAAHALFEGARPQTLAETQWGIAPDVPTNAGLTGGSAALAAAVAMVAHILRVEVPGDRAYSGVLRNGRFEAPAFHTLPGKLSALAEEGGVCRFLFCPGPPTAEASPHSMPPGVTLEWVQRPDLASLLARLLDQPESDVRSALRAPSLPPPELEMRLLELLAAAVRPLRPELLREAAGHTESWGEPLDISLDSFDRAVAELVRRGVATAIAAPEDGAFAQRYRLSPDAEGPTSQTMLRRRHAHAALSRLGQHAIYHAILAGRSDELFASLVDPSGEHSPLERVRTWVRELHSARAVDAACVRALVSRLEHAPQRGLVADLALLALGGAELDAPYGPLARMIGDADDPRELLFVLQAWLEASLHGLALLSLLEGDCDSSYLSLQDRIWAQPSVGGLMQIARRLASASGSRPYAGLAVAIAAAFADGEDPAAVVNQRLHGIGKWQELGSPGATEACLRAVAHLARGLARLVGPLRGSLLVGWSRGDEGWHVLRDGRLASGLMFSSGEVDFALRTIRDDRATYWSFSGPERLASRIARADVIPLLARLASCIPELEPALPKAPSSAPPIDRMPQPLARALAMRKRCGGDPILRLSAIDTAVGALLRMGLFACEEASGPEARSRHPRLAERLTRRSALASLEWYAASGREGAIRELARSVVGPEAGPYARALVLGLERAAHSPMPRGAFRPTGPLSLTADELEGYLYRLVSCTLWATGGLRTVGVGPDGPVSLDGFRAGPEAARSLAPGTAGARPPDLGAAGVYLLWGDETLPLGRGARMETRDGAPTLLLAEDPYRGGATWFWVGQNGVRLEG